MLKQGSKAIKFSSTAEEGMGQLNPSRDTNAGENCEGKREKNTNTNKLLLAFLRMRPWMKRGHTYRKVSKSTFRTNGMIDTHL